MSHFVRNGLYSDFFAPFIDLDDHNNRQDCHQDKGSRKQENINVFTHRCVDGAVKKGMQQDRNDSAYCMVSVQGK